MLKSLYARAYFVALEHAAIEREGTEMIALAPNNYYIKIDDNSRSSFWFNVSTLEPKLQLYYYIGITESATRVINS
ncbi:MAG: hypothetical protein EZS28_032624 [Streblomastix strix]|uniref:Uncharacterized protein n=1 Tax=Streblomastix strix TaxID=222440 RepID=A0A5J4UPB4_9EUKA|nr:MAG: hypothetical protein EZS28_032624 [Streblomastix strix]